MLDVKLTLECCAVEVCVIRFACELQEIGRRVGCWLQLLVLFLVVTVAMGLLQTVSGSFTVSSLYRRQSVEVRRAREENVTISARLLNPS